jgi:hypothetical protein
VSHLVTWPRASADPTPAIFYNLQNLVNSNAEPSGHLVEVKKMLSAMRNNLSHLGGQIRASYAAFCREVLERLKDCEQLSQHKELEFWTTWAP